MQRNTFYEGIKFKDTAGNWSSAFSDTIMLDTAAPDTSISSQPSSPTNSTSASFSFSSTETGSTFKCQLDSGGYSSCTSPKSYTGLAEGSHTFYVRATDAAGNTDATPASYTWIIDTTAPTGTISINSGSASTNSTTATLILSCTDTGSGCSQVQFSNDNTTWSTAETFSTSKSWTLISGDGTKTVYAKFKDTGGNWSSVYSDTIELDTVAPDTTITAQPSSPTNSTSASFSFSSTETGSTFKCQLDSGGYSSCTSPKSYTGLAAGSHTFYVKATDTAGNTDATPASYTWTIDTTAPTITINSVTTPTNSTHQTITGTVEAGATVNVATDTAASDGAATITGTTWSYTITGLVAGANNVTVTATDAAGNTVTATSAITLDTISRSSVPYLHHPTAT